MNERPSLEYMGHTIYFAENRDVWECDALDLSHVSLSKLKQAIAKCEADNRRLSDGGRPALLLVSYKLPEEVIVVLLDAEKEKAWIVRPEGVKTARYSDRKREKVDIANLVPRTPEADAAVQASREGSAAVAAARAEYDRLVAAIPRHTRDSLMSLRESAPPDPHA